MSSQTSRATFKISSSFWTSLTGAWQAAAANRKDVKRERDLMRGVSWRTTATNMRAQKKKHGEGWRVGKKPEDVSSYAEKHRDSISKRSNTSRNSVPPVSTESKPGFAGLFRDHITPLCERHSEIGKNLELRPAQSCALRENIKPRLPQEAKEHGPYRAEGWKSGLNVFLQT